MNNAPIIGSFTPENTVPLLVGEAQEFTITASDADGDVLSTQWFVNNLALAGQNSTSFTFTADELGEFEVKVLITDNKDYATHNWLVTVSNETGGGFSITGAAVAEQDGFSLWSWLASLLS